jgi:hypothetical protein
MHKTHFALCLFVDQRCRQESRPGTWQKYCSTFRSQLLYIPLSLGKIRICFSPFPCFLLIECIAFPSFQWWNVPLGVLGKHFPLSKGYGRNRKCWYKTIAATSALIFYLEQHLLVLKTGKWSSSKPQKRIGKHLV